MKDFSQAVDQLQVLGHALAKAQAGVEDDGRIGYASSFCNGHALHQLMPQVFQQIPIMAAQKAPAEPFLQLDALGTAAVVHQDQGLSAAGGHFRQAGVGAQSPHVIDPDRGDFQGSLGHFGFAGIEREDGIQTGPLQS